jgi:hypothetical protein
LGSGAPKGRVSLIRPRRDRIMGSSILASLSEAGGNDPCHQMNGPLPPHSPSDADRVETRPTPSHKHVACPFSRPLSLPGPWFFLDLRAHYPRFRCCETSIRESPSRIGKCGPQDLLSSRTVPSSRPSNAAGLCAVRLCRIMTMAAGAASKSTV